MRTEKNIQIPQFGKQGNTMPKIPIHQKKNNIVEKMKIELNI